SFSGPRDVSSASTEPSHQPILRSRNRSGDPTSSAGKSRSNPAAVGRRPQRHGRRQKRHGCPPIAGPPEKVEALKEALEPQTQFDFVARCLFFLRALVLMY